MTTNSQPWHGVLVATALPYTDDLKPDFDAFAEHLNWLAENGCDGAAVNGSLGEYQSLTDAERAQVVKTAVDVAPEGFTIMAGAGAYAAHQSLFWAEQAREAGASCIMLLPPNAYRAPEAAVIDHFVTAAKAGLPIVAYNNPIDTKVDLTPSLLARVWEETEGAIVGVKEFSGDVRRAWEVREKAPAVDLLIGSDDTLLEVALAGAVGWVAGYPNAMPASNTKMFRLATSKDPAQIAEATAMYRDLHELFRWDSRVEFVQAIKLSMDLAGRRGGLCRPPRLPLSPEQAAEVTAATEVALAKGY